eukprot:GEMP01038260.1.p1 GENE.GEMP01038260.1~~GEMP01038260.1.p1  ORF type:complete len:307 (+),score=47.31 GEMP01038260.1:54-974(+)
MPPAKYKFSNEGEDFFRRIIHPTRGIRYGRKTGVKTAVEVGLRKVRYVRGCDLIDHLEELTTEDGLYSDKRLEALNTNWLGTHVSAEEVGIRLLKEGLISAAVYRPRAGEKIRKFPDRLVRSGGQRAVERDGYYIMNIEERDKFMAVKIIALISGILSIVMFPAWPFWAKVGLWYFLILLLFGLISCILLRVVLFLVFWVAGIDFWILPNLFDEYVPWSEAFTPLLLVAKNYDDVATVSIRFLLLTSCALAIAELSRTWAVGDLASPALSSMEWGHDKLWERYHMEHTRAALPSLEELDKLENLEE